METTDTNTNDSNAAINPERRGEEACVQRVARPREPRSRSEMEAEARRIAEPYVQKMCRIWMVQSRTVIFLEGGEWHVEQRISDEWQAEVEALRAQMNLAISSALGAAHWPSARISD